MCCGSKRLDAARNAAPARLQAAPRSRNAAAGAGNTGNTGAMDNSGNIGNSAAAATTLAHGAGPVFVHDGAGELVVTGNASGRRYRFTGRGARAAVDLRDVAQLAAVHKLRRLA